MSAVVVFITVFCFVATRYSMFCDEKPREQRNYLYPPDCRRPNPCAYVVIRMVNHRSLSSPRVHLNTENRGTDPMACSVWVPNHSKYEKLGMFGHASEWILLATWSCAWATRAGITIDLRSWLNLCASVPECLMSLSKPYSCWHWENDKYGCKDIHIFSTFCSKREAYRMSGGRPTKRPPLRWKKPRRETACIKWGSKRGPILSHRMSPGRKVAGNHRRCNIKSTIAKYRGCRSFLEKQWMDWA